MEILKALKTYPKVIPCKFKNHLCVGIGCEDFAKVPYHGSTW
jgi:hypothetical protein